MKCGARCPKRPPLLRAPHDVPQRAVGSARFRAPALHGCRRAGPHDGPASAGRARGGSVLAGPAANRHGLARRPLLRTCVVQAPQQRMLIVSRRTSGGLRSEVCVHRRQVAVPTAGYTLLRLSLISSFVSGLGIPNTTLSWPRTLLNSRMAHLSAQAAFLLVSLPRRYRNERGRFVPEASPIPRRRACPILWRWHSAETCPRPQARRLAAQVGPGRPRGGHFRLQTRALPARARAHAPPPPRAQLMSRQAQDDVEGKLAAGLRQYASARNASAQADCSACPPQAGRRLPPAGLVPGAVQGQHERTPAPAQHGGGLRAGSEDGGRQSVSVVPSFFPLHALLTQHGDPLMSRPHLRPRRATRARCAARLTLYALRRRLEGARFQLTLLKSSLDKARDLKSRSSRWAPVCPSSPPPGAALLTRACPRSIFLRLVMGKVNMKMWKKHDIEEFKNEYNKARCPVAPRCPSVRPPVRPRPRAHGVPSSSSAPPFCSCSSPPCRCARPLRTRASFTACRAESSSRVPQLRFAPHARRSCARSCCSGTAPGCSTTTCGRRTRSSRCAGVATH